MPRPSPLVAVVLLTAAAGCLGQTSETGEGEPAQARPVLADASWIQHADAPSARTEVVAAQVEPGGDELLVIGGYVEGQTRRIVERYDASEDAWSSAPSYPVPIYHTAALNVDGEVMVFGGHSTPAFTPQDLVFRFETDASEWVLETRMPAARGAHDATVVDGKVYVVGGTDAERDSIARVDVYDPETGEWTRAPDLPNPRDHLAVVSANETVYAIGGRNVSLDANTGQVHALGPDDDAWTTREPMPTPRGGIGAERLQARIVVAGGERTDGTFSAVEAYDPANDTWTTLSDMPTARHGIATEVVDDRFYTFMGGPEPSVARSDAVESLG